MVAALPHPDAGAALSLVDQRRLALRAQRLAGARPASSGATLEALGAIQLDTISVIARSHLLVAWSRLGAVARERVEGAYWDATSPRSFEYWSHAACIIPVDRWPEYAFRRRERRARGWRWHRLADPATACAHVRARLLAEGPLTASELGGAKGGGPWWDWTEEKIAVEWLLDVGDVVCVERRGWRRVYDLAERALPAFALGDDLDDDECLRRLLRRAGRALGVATLAELGRHFGVTTARVAPLVAESGLVPVAAEGSRQPCFADPDALASLAERAASRTTLLSPFDSLVWDRPRTERLFGFVHRLEAYVPKAQRVHGYFTMPVLANGRLVGRVDPKRSATTLIARQVGCVSAAAAPAIGRALAEAARWVGCDTVELGRVEPHEARPALAESLNISP